MYANRLDSGDNGAVRNVACRGGVDDDRGKIDCRRDLSDSRRRNVLNDGTFLRGPPTYLPTTRPPDMLAVRADTLAAAMHDNSFRPNWRQREREVKYTDIAKFAGHLPHRYGNSRAIWDHTVLPATRQR